MFPNLFLDLRILSSAEGGQTGVKIGSGSPILATPLEPFTSFCGFLSFLRFRQTIFGSIQFDRLLSHPKHSVRSRRSGSNRVYLYLISSVGCGPRGCS